MTNTYNTPTLIVSGEIVSATLGTDPGVEIDGSPNMARALGSVGFML